MAGWQRRLSECMIRRVKYFGNLDLRWDEEKKEWIVLNEISVLWEKGNKKLAWFRVAAGFVTDLSSIPSIVPGWLFPKLGAHNIPSVVHDWCYAAKTTLTRAQADLLFLDGMKERGVPLWRRYMMYMAVRLFAKLWWRQ